MFSFPRLFALAALAGTTFAQTTAAPEATTTNASGGSMNQGALASIQAALSASSVSAAAAAAATATGAAVLNGSGNEDASTAVSISDSAISYEGSVMTVAVDSSDAEESLVMATTSATAPAAAGTTVTQVS